MAESQQPELTLNEETSKLSRGDGVSESREHFYQAPGCPAGCACNPNGASVEGVSPWSKWFAALLVRIGLIVFVYGIIFALQEFEIWEPCQYKISYHRECKVDTYIYEVLSYTTFQEDFFCVVPGITYHQTETGWNMDHKCT